MGLNFGQTLFGTSDDFLKDRYQQSTSTIINSYTTGSPDGAWVTFYTAATNKKTYITDITITNIGSQAKTGTAIGINDIVLFFIGDLGIGETHIIYLRTPVYLESGDTIDVYQESANASAVGLTLMGWKE